MADKINLLISSCFVIIMNAVVVSRALQRTPKSSGCSVPNEVVSPNRFSLPKFANKTWYTQGVYDTLSNPNNEVVCGVVDYNKVYQQDGAVNESTIYVHKVLSSPCSQDSVGQHMGYLVENPNTGDLAVHTFDPNTEQIVGYAPCYLVDGNTRTYHISYCCKELGNGHLLEALLYLTTSPNPEPNLAMKMHRRAKQRGLERPASKVQFLPPNACSGQ